jgi:hypothetical protein
MVCAHCMFARAAARDVRLALANLYPCQFNLMHSPVSWFELFASVEIRPPVNFDAWRAAATGLPNAPAALTAGGTQGRVGDIMRRRWKPGTVRGTYALAISSKPATVVENGSAQQRSAIMNAATTRTNSGLARPIHRFNRPVGGDKSNCTLRERNPVSFF